MSTRSFVNPCAVAAVWQTRRTVLLQLLYSKNHTALSIFIWFLLLFKSVRFGPPWQKRFSVGQVTWKSRNQAAISNLRSTLHGCCLMLGLLSHTGLLVCTNNPLEEPTLRRDMSKSPVSCRGVLCSSLSHLAQRVWYLPLGHLGWHMRRRKSGGAGERSFGGVVHGQTEISLSITVSCTKKMKKCIGGWDWGQSSTPQKLLDIQFIH